MSEGAVKTLRLIYIQVKSKELPQGLILHC